MQLESWQIAALAAGGFVSGIVNAMAGGGSFLTLPLLVVFGLPGTIANGTNRICVLAQSAVAAWWFAAEGQPGVRASRSFIVPLVAGATIGAVAVAQLADDTFERLFGLLMLVLLVPTLWAPRPAPIGRVVGNGSRGLAMLTFFAIGIYGGAFQAGVGVLLVLALARAGNDLVLANAVKSVVISAFTAVAVIVFLAEGQVVWVPALVLSAAAAAGAVIGARLAVTGGERLIRPVLAVAVVALAGRMLGLY